MLEEIARMSPLLRDTIEESGLDEPIPVDCSEEVLKLVVEYLAKVRENDGEEPVIDYPLIDTDIGNVLTDDWFINFIENREPE